MRERTTSLSAWLQSLPENAEILWHSTALNATNPWASGWVDIGVDALKTDSIGSCGITFIAPQHKPFQGDHFPLERDLDVHAVYDAADRFQTFALEVPVPRGTALTAEQEAQLVKAEAASPTCHRGICGGWSVAQLNVGLRYWSLTHAKRSDLQWTWDQNWHLPDEILSLLDGVQSGTEATYQIGNGLRVTERAFEGLLAIPGMFDPLSPERRALRAKKHAPPAEPSDPFDR